MILTYRRASGFQMGSQVPRNSPCPCLGWHTWSPLQFYLDDAKTIHILNTFVARTKKDYNMHWSHFTWLLPLGLGVSTVILTCELSSELLQEWLLSVLTLYVHISESDSSVRQVTVKFLAAVLVIDWWKKNNKSIAIIMIISLCWWHDDWLQRWSFYVACVLHLHVVAW